MAAGSMVYFDEGKESWFSWEFYLLAIEYLRYDIKWLLTIDLRSTLRFKTFATRTRLV